MGRFGEGPFGLGPFGTMPNLLTNPGAEDGTTDWWEAGDPASPSVITQDATHVDTGSWAFKVVTLGVVDYEGLQYVRTGLIQATPDTRYQFTARVYSVAGGEHLNLLCSDTDAGGTVWVANHYGDEVVLSAGWNTLSLIFTTDANAGAFKPQVTNAVVGAYTYWVDSMYVDLAEEASGDNLLENPGAELGITPWAVTPVGEQTLGAEILTNTGFETDTTGWTAGSNGTVTRETGIKRTGSGSLKTAVINTDTPGPTGWRGGSQGGHTVTNGQAYRISVAFYVPSGSGLNGWASGPIRMSLWDFDTPSGQDGTIGGYYIDVDLDKRDQWQVVTLDCIGDGSTNAGIRIAFSLGPVYSEAGNAYYIDDASLKPVTGTGSNVLTNGDAETGNTTGWTGSGVVSFTNDATHVHGGAHAFRVQTQGLAIDEGMSASGVGAPVTPGVLYTFDTWIYSVSGGEWLILVLQALAGDQVTETGKPWEEHQLAAGWNHFTINYTAPANTATIRPYIDTAWTHPPAAVTYWVDDISLTAPSGGGLTQDTTHVYEGTYAFKIDTVGGVVNEGLHYPGPENAHMPAEVGKTYDFTAHVYVEATGPRLMLKAVAHQGDTELGSASTAEQTLSAGWNTLTLSYEAPTDTTSIDWFVVTSDTLPAQALTFWVDACEVPTPESGGGPGGPLTVTQMMLLGIGGGEAGSDVTPPSPPAGHAFRPFADSSIWNTPIGATPKHASSDTWMASVRSRVPACFTNTNAWTPPIYWVVAGQNGWSRQTVYSHFNDWSLPGVPLPDSHVNPADPNGETQLIVIDCTGSPDGSDTSKWWVYTFEIVVWTGSRWDTYACGKFPFKSSGCWKIPARDGKYLATGRGAATAYLAGMPTLDELNNGIEHALAFMLPNSCTRGPATEYQSAICAEPAQRSDGNAGSNAAWPKYGFRTQLDPAFNVNGFTSDVQLRNLLTAWQVYGAIHGDSTGSSAYWTFQVPHTAGQISFTNPSHPSYSGAIVSFGSLATLLNYVWVVAEVAPGSIYYDDPTTVGGYVY